MRLALHGKHAEEHDRGHHEHIRQYPVAVIRATRRLRSQSSAIAMKGKSRAPKAA
jgi:hypothetical protein